MSNKFKYKERDDKFTVTAYAGNGGEVMIPSEIDGKPVIVIGDDAFAWCSSSTSVVILKGVAENC